mmetsp:Transcript_43807/g.42274  ORF Transcript_43807/g.42274 Transcript_43807/m.42274 type:complete len:303 (-) Transcript_43807:1051-1959(-)
MQPRIQIDDGGVFLVETEEVGEPPDVVGGDLGGTHLLQPLHEFVLHQLLRKARVVQSEIYGRILGLLLHDLAVVLEGFVVRELLAFGVLDAVLGEHNAEVQALVDQRCLQVRQGLVDFAEFVCFDLAEELVDEVGDGEDLVFAVGSGAFLLVGVEFLRNHIEQELQDVPIHIHLSRLERLYELVLVDVSIPSDVYRGQPLLYRQLLVRKHPRADVCEDLLGSFQAGLAVEMDLFLIVVLDHLDLDDAGVVGVQFVHDGVDLFLRELGHLPHLLLKVLDEPLSSAELVGLGLVGGEEVGLEVR